MSTLMIELSPELAARLDALASSRGAARADVARALIETALAGAPAVVAPPPGREPTPGSALDLAGDLVGCVEGPGDLSTNPKHMEGYGR